MRQYTRYAELNEQIEILISAVLILLVVLAVVVIRNWYNLYKKRSFRKLNKKLKAQLDTYKLKHAEYDSSLQKIADLELITTNKQSEILELQLEIEEYKEKFYATLNNKDKEISKQKEAIAHQQKAYERYVNFKNVEANNTRLGAHFIKNVISQIYEDLGDVEENYKTFLGIRYKKQNTENKIPPIKALKNIFKLLDYNVAALNEDSTTLENELKHVSLFLELINYLKPNTKIELNNTLNNELKHNLKIKPTLFFPFVENALKHGSLNDVNSFISIDLKENDQQQLSYCLVNSAEQAISTELNKSTSGKFGLNALKQLIDAYYPGSKIEHTFLPNRQYMSQLTLNIN